MAEIEECVLSRALDFLSGKKEQMKERCSKTASERYYTDIERDCYSIVEGRGFQSIQKVNGGSSCGCRCYSLEQAFFFSLSLFAFISQSSAQRVTHEHNYRLSLSSSHLINVAVPTEIGKTNPPEKKRKEKTTTQQCRRKSDLGVKIRKAKRKRKSKKSQEISLDFFPLPNPFFFTP